MIFNDNDIFDTPYTRYCDVKHEFEEKYSNPKAWRRNFDHTEGIREYVQACHDLLVYVEKSKEFGELDPRIKEELAVDNLHLIRDLPLPMKMWEMLNDWIVEGLEEYQKLTPELEVEKMVKFFEKEKSCKLHWYEMEYRKDLENARDHDKFENDIKAAKRNAVKVEEDNVENDRERENRKLAVSAKEKRIIQFDKIGRR